MILSDVTIGFVGFGKIASAIWESLVRHQAIPHNQVVFCTKHLQTQKKIALKYGLTAVSIDTLVRKSQLIILATKPQDIGDALSEFPKNVLHINQLVLSVLAGTSIAYLESKLGSNIPIMRAMPNLPCAIGEGITALTFNKQVTLPFQLLSHQLFTYCGHVLDVKEKDLNTITALSGSGPAFFARLLHAMASEAEQQGLAYEIALKFLTQTLVGTGRFLQETGTFPMELVAEVSSPNGTTQAGLSVFDQTKIEDHIKQVLQASARRAHLLSIDP